ncbi:MAG TPA: aldo/keto reductase [Sphingobacteriaceae bacterium]
MQYQFLGKSDLKVSEVSMGCMSLNPEDPHSLGIIRAAIDSGINFFDTADLYNKGANEAMLGRALRSDRKSHLIATKVGNRWREDGSGWDWVPSMAYIRAAVDESLKRLQTDYIDLYQLHGGMIGDPIDEIIETFESLKQSGKIRYYGISSIRPNVIREYARRSGIVSVMMQYSLLDRRPEEECLGRLSDLSIGVLARGSLAQGLLVDKPARSYLVHTEENVSKAARAVHFVAGETNTAAQTAIGFVLKHPAVISAVAGVRTPEQLSQAIPPLDLTDREYGFLKDSVQNMAYTDHR